MKKTIYAGLLLVCLMLMLVISVSQAQTQPVFRIGILDEERGPISSGARLAVSRINDAGGVRGADGTFFRLELIIQPSNIGAALDEAIATLEQASVIAVLGPETSEQVLGNLTALQTLGVPILTPAIGDTVIASDSAELLFRTRAAERLQGAALGDYLTNDLSVTNLATVQLDSNSTASRVGFSLSLSQLPNAPEEQTLPILEDTTELPNLVAQALELNTQAIVAYGPPEIATAFYNQLRGGGFVGIFAYNQAENPVFRNGVSSEQLRGVLSTTTWPLASFDGSSNDFLNAYVRAFGEVPGAVEAASYD
ncbi:MAG: amino acid ABC transporter substrate-binding protein, partial [Chitinophagaceae bacterium]|nr:amino acid ABC transporter substrate-binding protein [Anaerolineae bacterium]